MVKKNKTDITTLEELRHEFGEFHHEWSNNYKEKRFLKIDKFINKLIKEDPLEKMLQQFLGFRLGSQGFSITELVSGAGLTKVEWEILKKHNELESFLESDKQEIENYVNTIG